MIHTDAASLAWASRDYGMLVHERPLGVLRPSSVEEISSFAGTSDVPVVPRGRGHSTAGQAQAPGGVVVDMSGLNAVHSISGDRIDVGAGATWSDVLRATLPLGLTPPVLTDYLELSVGGTLSVGGLGGMSHHHGAQSDNVFELEVVRPSGEVVVSSDGPQLAGRGRAGIITRAVLRLVPAPLIVHWYVLRYSSLAALVADQRRLVLDGRFDYLEGHATPDGLDIEAVGYAGPVSLDGLAPDSVEVREASYWDFANRLAEGEQLLRSVGAWDVPHPWCNVLVPDPETFLADEELRGPLYGDFGLLIVYPLLTAKLRTITVPSTDIAFLVAALRHTAPDDADAIEAMNAANSRWRTKAVETGGTLYLH